MLTQSRSRRLNLHFKATFCLKPQCRSNRTGI